MFDIVLRAALGSMTVEMQQMDSVSSSTKTIYLIDNEMREGNHLVDFTYKQATNESPSFKSEFASNEQSVLFVFQILNINLHRVGFLLQAAIWKFLAWEKEFFGRKFQMFFVTFVNFAFNRVVSCFAEFFLKSFLYIKK